MAWPTLDRRALHGLTGDVVATLEPHTEADPAALAATFLVFAGASIGSGPHAVADAASHPGRLFAAIVGNTADGRKGSAASNVRRVFEVADPEFTASRVLGGFGSGEILVDAVRDGTEDDPGADDRRLLVYEPELARIFKVAARDGSTLSPIVRDAWDGGRLQARSRAKTSVASDASVAVLGHVTPDELRRYLTETEIAAGLGNRFLYVLSRRSKRLPEGGNLDDATVRDLGERTRERIDRARTIGRLHRSDAGRGRWSELYDVMADEARGGLAGTLLARAEAQTLRLSALYAVIDGQRLIDVEHIDAAWAFWRYCRATVEYLWAETTGDPVADRLLEALREAEPAGLDGTALQDLFARHVTGKRLEAARQLLVDYDLAEVVEDRQTGGRPRVVTYAVANKASEARKGGVSSPGSLSSQSGNTP